MKGIPVWDTDLQAARTFAALTSSLGWPEPDVRANCVPEPARRSMTPPRFWLNLYRPDDGSVEPEYSSPGASASRWTPLSESSSHIASGSGRQPTAKSCLGG